MLILERSLGKPEFSETYLTVGDVVITVKLVKIKDGSVRLGFDAPPEVSIVRANAGKKE